MPFLLGKNVSLLKVWPVTNFHFSPFTWKTHTCEAPSSPVTLSDGGIGGHWSVWPESPRVQGLRWEWRQALKGGRGAAELGRGGQARVQAPAPCAQWGQWDVALPFPQWFQQFFARILTLRGRGWCTWCFPRARPYLLIDRLVCCAAAAPFVGHVAAPGQAGVPVPACWLCLRGACRPW